MNLLGRKVTRQNDALLQVECASTPTLSQHLQDPTTKQAYFYITIIVIDTNACVHACIQRVHTHMHTHIHKHAHAHAHTHTHTHTGTYVSVHA